MTDDGPSLRAALDAIADAHIALRAARECVLVRLEEVRDQGGQRHALRKFAEGIADTVAAEIASCHDFACRVGKVV